LTVLFKLGAEQRSLQEFLNALQVLWNKINYLTANINLSPWYLSGGFQSAAQQEEAKV
jgi:hypothetical protein